MPDDRNEKPQVVRSPEPKVELAREAKERRRVAEITREIEELGRALEDRDRLARFDKAERAQSSSARTLQPEPSPTVASMFSGPKEVSPQIGTFATIPAMPPQRKPVAGGVPPTRRRKWGVSLAAVIIVLALVSGGALMPMSRPIAIAQDAYRSVVAEMQRLTARQNVETKAAARKAAEEKALAEELKQKVAEEKLAAVAAARRHEEEARQAADVKARTVAAREMAEAQARAAAQEATKRQAAEDARVKAEEAARNAAEAKPKSDAEVKEQAEKAEAGLKLSEQDRKRVQVALNSLGHEMPTVTGYFGPRTRAMITAWQKAQGLPETGYLTEAQLAILRQQAAAALAKYDQAQRRVKEDPRKTE